MRTIKTYVRAEEREREGVMGCSRFLYYCFPAVFFVEA
jgi:hypothetical protein